MANSTIADKVQAVLQLGEQCLTLCAAVIEGNESDIDKLMTAIESCQEGLEQLVRIAKNNASKLSHTTLAKVKAVADQCHDAMRNTYEDLDAMDLGFGFYEMDVLAHVVNMAARVRLDDVGPLTVTILTSRRSVDEVPVDMNEFALSQRQDQRLPARTKKEQSPNRDEQLAHTPARAPPVLYVDKLTIQPDRQLETDLEPWADLSLMRKWIQQCDTYHREHCSLPSSSQAIFNQKPKWLIDVDKKCLVPGYEVPNYLTLSYVWGDVARLFRTNKRILDCMLNEGYLAQPEVLEQIPKTITDSIQLTQLLGQRYLWVDCMCIVEDDEIEFKEQLEAMASIYANSYLTLVATTGASNTGLYGIKGTTPPFARSDTSSVSLRQAIERHHEKVVKSVWHKRGWTFQEQILSRRIIVLSPSDVSWECHCAVWFEGMEPIDGKCGAVDHIGHEGPAVVSSAGLWDFARHVYAYNMRDLSFSDDVARAFVGILTTLNSNFTGGFACGLPIDYFDVALLWRNTGILSKRWLTPGELNDRPPLPSWSWMLWRGVLLLDCWTKEHHEHNQALVGWSYKTDLGKPWIPLTKNPRTESQPLRRSTRPLSWQMQECPLYLRGDTQRAFFYTIKKPAGVHYYSPTDGINYAISTAEGSPSGYLTAVRCSWQQPGTVCEVVAISETDLATDFAAGTTSIPDSVSDPASADMKSSTKTWLNVLWIEWYKGVAYRKGLGQVSKPVWEQEEARGRIETIDLVLG